MAPDPGVQDDLLSVAKIPRTYRLPVPLDARVEDAAAERKVTRTDVVVRALERELPAPDDEVVDLVDWIAERTELPKSIVRSKVRGGKVWIDGRPWKQPEASQSVLNALVLMDGVVIE